MYSSAIDIQMVNSENVSSSNQESNKSISEDYLTAKHRKLTKQV